MTGDEKVKQDIASRSREEKMDEIRDRICDWDLDSLIDYVQYRVEQDLSPMSDNDFDDEYYEWFCDRYESGDYEDDEPEDEVVTVKALEERCRCGKMKDAGRPCWWCGQ